MREAYYSGGGTPFDWAPFIGYGRPPYASIVVGPFAILAGPSGVAVGSFGWVDPGSGLVTNSLVEGAPLGFVLPLVFLGDPNVATWSVANGFRQRVLRSGMACAVAAKGDFRMHFQRGGNAGTRVYVDGLTGLPYAEGTFSEAPDYIPTPWTLMQTGGPAGMLRISSFVPPFN